jgi:hypothetical protein
VSFDVRPAGLPGLEVEVDLHAGLIVAESARREGIRIRFVDYLKVGVPVTIVTLGFGVWWLAR